MAETNSIQADASEAVGALYLTHKSRLLLVIARYVDCPSEREDVLQEVFLRVNRSLHRFRADCAMSTWLHRIARNTSINHLRKKHNTVKHTQLHEQDLFHNDTPEELAVASESADRINEQLSGLSAVCQTTLKLRSSEGLSYDDIAAAMQVPTGTVRSRLNRTRASLTNAIT